MDRWKWVVIDVGVILYTSASHYENFFFDIFEERLKDILYIWEPPIYPNTTAPIPQYPPPPLYPRIGRITPPPSPLYPRIPTPLYPNIEIN